MHANNVALTYNSILFGDCNVFGLEHVLDFKLNPTHKFLLVKNVQQDRSTHRAVGGQNVNIHFRQAVLAHLLLEQNNAVLPTPDKLSHPIFSLKSPSDGFDCPVNNIDDAGLRDVRALPDLTVLGCIHGGINFPQQQEIRSCDSCFLQ
jgi:hypothetical protein